MKAGQGQSVVIFKDRHGRKVHFSIAFTNTNLEKLEILACRTYPHQDFTLGDFFCSLYSPVRLRLAITCLAVDSKFDETAYRTLMRYNPGELKDQWREIQKTYAYWAERKDLIEIITGEVQDEEPEEDEDELGND